MGAAGTKEPRRVPQFTQNVFVAAFTVPQAGHAIEADKRYPRRASRRELVEPCGGWPTRGRGISAANRAGSLFPNRRYFAPPPGNGTGMHPTGRPPLAAVPGWVIPLAARPPHVPCGAV